MQIWQSIQTADLALFLFSSVISLLCYFFVRALRWHLLLKTEQLDIPFYRLYLYNTISTGFSTITPFQSGEALKVELLRKHGGSRTSGYTIFFIEKILDFAAIIALGIIGVWQGFDFGIPRIYYYFAAVILISVFLVSVILVFKIKAKFLVPVRELLLSKWSRKSHLLGAAILTVSSWFAVILGWKFALASVAVTANLWQSISLVSLSTLLAIISFVPGAVGVTEISVTAILTNFGFAVSLAQTGAVAIRAYALMILLLTLLHWIVLRIALRFKY